jgi:tetratricopeptide (TPR) repeat protein
MSAPPRAPTTAAPRRYADFDQALARAPGYAVAHYKKGETLAELRRFPEALAHLDAALRLEPESALFYASRGSILQDAKNLEAALRDFDQAIRLEPEAARYHQGRGLVFQDMRRFREAAAAFDRALKLDRNLPLLQGQALAISAVLEPQPARTHPPHKRLLLPHQLPQLDQ